jgi:hypothetical protein
VTKKYLYHGIKMPNMQDIRKVITTADELGRQALTILRYLAKTRDWYPTHYLKETLRTLEIRPTDVIFYALPKLRKKGFIEVGAWSMGKNRYGYKLPDDVACKISKKGYEFYQQYVEYGL